MSSQLGIHSFVQIVNASQIALSDTKRIYNTMFIFVHMSLLVY